MNEKSLTNIAVSARTSFAPYGFRRGVPTPTSISNFISPIQFQRFAHDVFMWRDAIKEMELPFYPSRVKAQRMFMDTVENGYVKAVIERWKDLTRLRDYTVYQRKNGKEIESKDLTQQLSYQTWFDDYIDFALDAILYGYSLIEMGDIVDDSFPNISFTRRENIRPDGILGDTKSEILTSLIYAIDGVRIEDDPLIRMCNHWIPTKSNRGVSSCGYGLLYNIALCEIHLRHIMEWNMDYVEMFGMPIKKGTTNKTGTARKKFKDFLKSSASNSWALLDKATGDDITYEMVQNAGTAWKSYENVEVRLKDIIAQLVLGHTDAMKSTAGKLGGMQAANKDGFNESLIEQAMNDKQTNAGDFICRKVNEVFAPRMRQLGKYVGSKQIYGLLPEGYYFGLKNDKEEAETERRKNAQNLVKSNIAKNLSTAGFIRNAKELGKDMGMDLKYQPYQRDYKETRTVIDGDVPEGHQNPKEEKTEKIKK